jgi:glycosyltransferase involved in cell wall biosynthesis
MKICVLIPTYNESKAIGEIVSDVRKEGFEVVVIDDGSSDDTAAIAKDSGAYVITHERNMGKGASIKNGFAYVLEKGFDAAVIMDGDGQHDTRDIERFVKAAESTGADLVIGNRMENPSNMPFIRRLTNRWMSGFISKLSGHVIPDTQCGFRLVRSGLIRKVRLLSAKYETESEILIKAARGDFKIHSIPIKSVYKGEVSAIHPVKDGIRFVRLILNINNNKYTGE